VDAVRVETDCSTKLPNIVLRLNGEWLTDVDLNPKWKISSIGEIALLFHNYNVAKRAQKWLAPSVLAKYKEIIKTVRANTFNPSTFLKDLPCLPGMLAEGSVRGMKVSDFNAEFGNDTSQSVWEDVNLMGVVEKETKFKEDSEVNVLAVLPAAAKLPSGCHCTLHNDCAKNLFCASECFDGVGCTTREGFGHAYCQTCEECRDDDDCDSHCRHSDMNQDTDLPE